MAKNRSAAHRLAIRCALTLIRGYQTFISPILGPSCRFYPTCSHYSVTAIERFGILKGGWLATKRILRCHPLNAGGNDPVPEKHNENN